MKISLSTKIESNCKIECSEESSLEISNSYISFGSHISAKQSSQIKIQDSFIGRNCVIASISAITISRNCQIAEMTVIRDQDHKFGDIKNTIANQGFISEPIFIGENVWLANKVTVLKGVSIGNNSIVGANAVVNKDIPDNTIYAGVPAKLVRGLM